MKILFIGRTEWLYNSIVEINMLDKHEIIGIVTSSSTNEYKVREEDFSLLADRLGIKYLFSNKLKKSEITDTFGENIDIAISVNHLSIIDEDIINLFKYGILNAHGGDLPRYRGNAQLRGQLLMEKRKLDCVYIK